MYIYKINHNGYEDGSYLFLSNTKEYTLEQFKSVFNQSLLEAKEIEKKESTERMFDLWVYQYLSKAIDIMIEKYQFSHYEPIVTQEICIFTDTDIIKVDHYK